MSDDLKKLKQDLLKQLQTDSNNNTTAKTKSSLTNTSPYPRTNKEAQENNLQSDTSSQTTNKHHPPSNSSLPSDKFSQSHSWLWLWILIDIILITIMIVWFYTLLTQKHFNIGYAPLLYLLFIVFYNGYLWENKLQYKLGAYQHKQKRNAYKQQVQDNITQTLSKWRDKKK